MAQFKPGDEVHVECEIGPGAFPTEYLVTFDTVDGPVSGFTRRENIERDDRRRDIGFIQGTVVEVSEDIITVLVRGSFFTTTGIAAFKRDWADRNVRVAHAA